MFLKNSKTITLLSVLFFIIILITVTYTTLIAAEKIKVKKWTPLDESEKQISEETHLKFESAEENFYYYRGFVSNYDKEKRRPNFVVQKLTYAQLKDSSLTKIRRNELGFKFFPDTYSIKERKLQVKYSDFTNTSWDRGHLAPAGDFPYDTALMTESFVTTNVTPQSIKFNQILWKNIETKTRDYVLHTKNDCYVITGAVYDNSIFRSFRNTLKRNKKNLYLPAFHYKIVYSQVDGKHYSFSFLVEHNLQYDTYTPVDYLVSTDKIEEMSGFDFFEKLPDHIEDSIEAETFSSDSFLINW